MAFLKALFVGLPVFCSLDFAQPVSISSLMVGCLLPNHCLVTPAWPFGLPGLCPWASKKAVLVPVQGWPATSRASTFSYRRKPEVFDTTFSDTDTILIPSRYEYSIPIRYWYFSVIKFWYRYWYWYFSALKFRYRYWYWYFHQMDWYPIWYQNLLEIAIFCPKINEIRPFNSISGTPKE